MHAADLLARNVDIGQTGYEVDMYNPAPKVCSAQEVAILTCLDLPELPRFGLHTHDLEPDIDRREKAIRDVHVMIEPQRSLYRNPLALDHMQRDPHAMRDLW